MKNKVYELDGLKLTENLQNKIIKQENMTKDEKKAVILFFLQEQSEISNAQIGKLLGMTGQNVGITKKNLLKDGISEIEEIDIKLLAVSLTNRKNEYQRKAVRDGNLALAWKIEMDYIEKMQSLGFVYEAPKKYEVATYEVEWEQRMKEFLDECGSSTPDEFFRQLRELQEGDGKKLLEPPHN